MKPKDDTQPGASDAARRQQCIRRALQVQAPPWRQSTLEPSTNADEMDTEEPCTSSSKRVKTTMGLEICVLEPMDDVFGSALHGPRLRTPTSPSTTMTMCRQR